MARRSSRTGNVLTNLLNLYPQYLNKSDRRKEEQPVDVDNRSGIDRRFLGRNKIDLKLANDVSFVKGLFQRFGFFK
jgi:hypothetical protein